MSKKERLWKNKPKPELLDIILAEYKKHFTYEGLVAALNAQRTKAVIPSEFSGDLDHLILWLRFSDVADTRQERALSNYHEKAVKLTKSALRREHGWSIRGLHFDFLHPIQAISDPKLREIAKEMLAQKIAASIDLY